MKIINYKHLKNINFSLSNSTTIFSNDILINQDLMELIELIIKGKNPDFNLIKMEECDTIMVNKNFKIVRIPSLFDLRKNVLSGTKSLLVMLIKEIILSEKYINENLNLIQNLIQNFNILEEIKQLKQLQQEVQELTNLTLDLEISEVIENYFSENINAVFTNLNQENVKEENISLIQMRIIYFKILQFFSAYLENEVFFIFDNPYLGLSYKDIKIIKDLMEKIPNKLCLTNILLNVNSAEIESLNILLTNLSINFPVILNDWNLYQFYLTKNYDSKLFLTDFSNKMLKLINLYDEEWAEYEKLSENELLFWENLKNKSLF